MKNRKAQNVFESIIGFMAEGVIFVDADDVIRICNPAAERIRRVRASKIIGQTIYDIHPPAAHGRIKDLLHNLRHSKVAASTRLVKAGERDFENSYSGIFDPDGSYLGTLLLSRDVTELRRLSQENQSLKSLTHAKESAMVCQSPAMRRIMEMVAAVARLDSTVLITGESGVGKELIFRQLHAASLRHSQPLVMLNCAALPDNLIETELFGHARGAFTGAVDRHEGRFVEAHGGTLFLDEIGELPLLAQAKLLRALQEKVVRPVGAERDIRVDVRIVAATNGDLEQMVRQGRFREDLYYRLNVITLTCPPLRERREDIIPLAELFVRQFCQQMNKPFRKLSPQTIDLLLQHSFPGNIRQLKHAIERAVALGTSDMILPEDLPEDLSSLSAGAMGVGFVPGVGLKGASESFERAYLLQALGHFCGRKTATADALGISRKSLWEKLQRYGLLGVELSTVAGLTAMLY